MNQFHRQRLFSEIRESHQIPIQADWAYAIRKQARLILLPLFRELIVAWREEKTGKRPILTELAEELFRGFFSNESIRMSVYSEVEKTVSKFLGSLNESQSAALGFYFLSKEKELNTVFQEVLDRGESEGTTLEETEKEVGLQFLDRYHQLSKEDLIEFLLEELGEIENIISNCDLERDLDSEAITRVNEFFSNYLDLPYGEISLIQMPIEEWDFWEKVTAEEPETVGKKVHTSKGLEWAKCWLLPNGETKVKGNLEDPGDRDQAAIQSIRQELPVILKVIHEALIKNYGLFDLHIHYTFFTKWESLENVIPGEGVKFFADQIEAHGSDDFESKINIDIRRYQNKVLQEWGTQITLGIDERYWLTEDQQYEYNVWVFTVEGKEIPLETRFTEEQIEAIIQSILENVQQAYLTQSSK